MARNAAAHFCAMARNAAAQLSTGAATAHADPASKHSRLGAPGDWGLYDSMSPDPITKVSVQTVCQWSPELHALYDCGVSNQQLSAASSPTLACIALVHAKVWYWLCRTHVSICCLLAMTPALQL